MKRRDARGFSYSVFYEQAAEGGYVASVPALSGCHTQGQALEEAERNIKKPSRCAWRVWRRMGKRFPERAPLFKEELACQFLFPLS
jgi:hypothetical protein